MSQEVKYAAPDVDENFKTVEDCIVKPFTKTYIYIFNTCCGQCAFTGVSMDIVQPKHLKLTESIRLGLQQTATEWTGTDRLTMC